MTHEDLEKEVWRLFELLEPKPKEIIRERWKKFSSELPPVLTKTEHIDDAEIALNRKVDVAGTDGVSMYFRKDKMENLPDDPRLIILEELAHCYLFASGKFKLRTYRESPTEMKKCEKEAVRLSKIWLKRISEIDRANGTPQLRPLIPPDILRTSS